MNTAMKLNRKKLPVKTLMSFWRSRLNKLLREDVFLRRIVVNGRRLSFETQSWDEYWRGVFPRVPTSIRRLYQAWNNHRQNGFCRESGRVLGAAYMDAVREAQKGSWSKDAQKRLLSFENTVICRMDATQPMAAMTTNFRNPILLLRQSDSAACSRYNQTLLLPLMAAGDGEETKVFFHYRRQSLLRNTDDGLFFFPCVDLSIRGDSFCILQELVEVLVNEWDSRIEQRVNLLSDKVILPLLPGLKKRTAPLRVLDVGSGVGLFTSRLIKRFCNGDDTKQHLFELTMMDQLVVDPERYFREHTLNKNLVNLEYIQSDYAEGIQNLAARQSRQPTFDLVMLLRILHNISRFNITASLSDGTMTKPGRYETGHEMSDYFQLIAQAFPGMEKCNVQTSSGEKRCWLPEREFNSGTLVLPNGKSLIDAITRIGRVAIVEDGDLSPEILEQHREHFKLNDVVVHDLSRHLRLSTNHVYVISRKGINAHLGGGAAWLN